MSKYREKKASFSPLLLCDAILLALMKRRASEPYNQLTISFFFIVIFFSLGVIVRRVPFLLLLLLLLPLLFYHGPPPSPLLSTKRLHSRGAKNLPTLRAPLNVGASTPRDGARVEKVLAFWVRVDNEAATISRL